MQRSAQFDPIEDAPLLALRRTLWQLAVVGFVAAVLIERIAPDAHALMLWCALAPFSALAIHFRRELWAMFRGQANIDIQHVRARRGRRLQAVTRRSAAMAVRRSAGLGLASAR